jgi:hypothetical protein
MAAFQAVVVARDFGLSLTARHDGPGSRVVLLENAIKLKNAAFGVMV